MGNSTHRQNHCPASFCIKKMLKYGINCAGPLHKDKNQFIYDCFDYTFFLMGGVTKVMTVGKSQEKKEVKLQKRLSINNPTQLWNLGMG